MEKCPQCNVWLVTCPCCSESFCPSCGALEEQLEEQAEGDEE